MRDALIGLQEITVSTEMVGKNIKFSRIRRVTGYLAGSLDRFNNAKLSEVKDRLLHGSI